MSTQQTTANITPVSYLKSTAENTKNYFTYPQSKHNHTANGYSPICDDSMQAEIKVKTINNLKYRSISTSPSVSSSSSNENFSETIETNKKWYFKLSNWFKILIIIMLLTILITAAIFNDITLKYSKQFLDWMNNYPIKGSFAFIAVYIMCSVIMIPGSILTLGAGFVYVRMFGQMQGVIVASAVVWFGATFGSILAFINGRYLLRNIVEYYTHKSSKFALIDNVVGMNGFKVTFLLRLSPITPYNIFNYFMGLTSVKLSDYSFACVGMIPDSCVYCFIGGSIASITKLSSVGFASDPILLIVTICGSIAAICGVLYISYIAKKEFKKMASQSNVNRQIDENTGMYENENEHVLGMENLHGSLGISINDTHEDSLENDIDCVSTTRENDSKNLEHALI